ncbi:MAG: hypothetical protein V4681_01150 [Patescibacteria group bacterium]
MALPPTVPTSFVPKQPVATTRRARSGVNVFMLVAMIVAGLALLASAGIFGYLKFLESARDAKAEQLREAEASISRATVEEFLRLRNRFSSTGMLLDQHVALSQYFDVLETLTLQSVTFDSLKIATKEDRTATLEMTGSARNFNALAAQSSAFAAEKRIKRAIFSGISTQEKGLIDFTLSAELDPSVLIWRGPVAPPVETVPTQP